MPFPVNQPMNSHRYVQHYCWIIVGKYDNVWVSKSNWHQPKMKDSHLFEGILQTSTLWCCDELCPFSHLWGLLTSMVQVATNTRVATILPNIFRLWWSFMVRLFMVIEFVKVQNHLQNKSKGWNIFHSVSFDTRRKISLPFWPTPCKFHQSTPTKQRISCPCSMLPRLNRYLHSIPGSFEFDANGVLEPFVLLNTFSTYICMWRDMWKKKQYQPNHVVWVITNYLGRIRDSFARPSGVDLSKKADKTWLLLSLEQCPQQSQVCSVMVEVEALPSRSLRPCECTILLPATLSCCHVIRVATFGRRKVPSEYHNSQ